ncbi:MAG: hydrogenase maturation nickel metallochaperone HypA/HybF [Endomicrobiales bacterium]
MHELGIAQDFWAVVKQHAEAGRLKAVTKITLVVGEASGIEIDFLQHSLRDHVLPGTIAEGAELKFVPKKLVARCKTCGREIGKDTIRELCCPGCGGADIEIITGKETYVESIEGE